MGLASVLNDLDAALLAEGREPFHVRHSSVKMYGDDGARAPRDAPRSGVRLQKQAFWIHVGENRARARCQDRLRREWSSEGAGDNLVTGADAAGAQRNLQRLSPVSHSDSKPGAAELRPFALERLQFFIQDVARAVKHTPDGGIELAAQARGLPGKIKKWNSLKSQVSSLKSKQRLS